jgi:hypothetical protein
MIYFTTLYQLQDEGKEDERITPRQFKIPVFWPMTPCILVDGYQRLCSCHKLKSIGIRSCLKKTEKNSKPFIHDKNCEAAAICWKSPAQSMQQCNNNFSTKQ